MQFGQKGSGREGGGLTSNRSKQPSGMPAFVFAVPALMEDLTMYIDCAWSNTSEHWIFEQDSEEKGNDSDIQIANWPVRSRTESNRSKVKNTHACVRHTARLDVSGFSG